jgi:anti-anti-sigma regulatory factor
VRVIINALKLMAGVCRRCLQYDCLPEETEDYPKMSENPLITVEVMSDRSRALRLVGELSVFHASQLYDVAMGLAQEEGDVLLECRELHTVDLAVAQILLALQRLLLLQGRRFCIHQPSGELAELFRLVGLGREVTSSPAIQVGEGAVRRETPQTLVRQA